MTDEAIEIETAPETASFRHYRRMMWQTVRARFEEARAEAWRQGLGDEEGRRVAARAVRGDIRAFMAELLVRAPVPAILEFLVVGRDWGAAGERLFENDDAVIGLVENAYPRPTWTDIQPLGPKAAADDTQWSAWIESWTAALRATGPAADKALAGELASEGKSQPQEQVSTLRRWAPWLVGAAVISTTTIIVMATRE